MKKKKPAKNPQPTKKKIKIPKTQPCLSLNIDKIAKSHCSGKLLCRQGWKEIVQIQRGSGAESDPTTSADKYFMPFPSSWVGSGEHRRALRCARLPPPGAGSPGARASTRDCAGFDILTHKQSPRREQELMPPSAAFMESGEVF